MILAFGLLQISPAVNKAAGTCSGSEIGRNSSAFAMKDSEGMLYVAGDPSISK